MDDQSASSIFFHVQCTDCNFHFGGDYVIFHYFFQIRSIYASVIFDPCTICDKIEKTTEKSPCPETLNPYTISGRIEPEALIVSQIVHGSHLRFWRCLYYFWTHLKESVQYMRNIKRGPVKIEIAIHTLYATKYSLFF